MVITNKEYENHGYNEQIICDSNNFLELQWNFEDFNEILIKSTYFYTLYSVLCFF